MQRLNANNLARRYIKIVEENRLYFNNYITGYGVKSIVELEIIINLFKETYIIVDE